MLLPQRLTLCHSARRWFQELAAVRRLACPHLMTRLRLCHPSAIALTQAWVPPQRSSYRSLALPTLALCLRPQTVAHQQSSPAPQTLASTTVCCQLLSQVSHQHRSKAHCSPGCLASSSRYVRCAWCHESRTIYRKDVTCQHASSPNNVLLQMHQSRWCSQVLMGFC